MTHRELFTKTLKCEKVGGQVPHFELVYYLTMERFGKVHPLHRDYSQWNQMSVKEQMLHIKDMAKVYVDTARFYNHSAIFVHGNPYTTEVVQQLLESIRDISGNEFYLTMHGDPTWPIPDGDSMLEFSEQMYEEPEKLNEQSKRRSEIKEEMAYYFHNNGHLLDGFCMCADYCFNANPFYSPEKFDELIVPYLKGIISTYHELGYTVIKHTDGNIMPIVKQIADCKPDAIHSLDPQGGVSIPEVRKIIGDNICLIGNVNCGLLQTGTEEECKADVMRSLKEGMERGYGYVFATSNCVYTGMPLERYEIMHSLWQKYGNYDNKENE